LRASAPPLASRVACHTIAGVLTRQTTPLPDRMVQAIRRAHQAVAALEGPHAGAATTAVLAVWRHGEDRVRHVSVGDSRLFRVDTTGLTRALGIGEPGDVVVHDAPFGDGEMLVASTDGFHDLPGFAAAIAEIFEASAIGPAAVAKLTAIHDLAGYDDASVVLLRRESVPATLVESCVEHLRRRPAIAPDEDRPRHLLRQALADAMAQLIAEGDLSAVLHGLAVAERLRMTPSRERLGALLDALPADGSADALEVYRRLVRLAGRAT